MKRAVPITTASDGSGILHWRAMDDSFGIQNGKAGPMIDQNNASPPKEIDGG
jgi:hypothetical protein